VRKKKIKMLITKSDYIKYSAEIEKIEMQMEILSSHNPIEATQITLLQIRLDELLLEIKKPKLRVL
jgi:hypothetical protein